MWQTTGDPQAFERKRQKGKAVLYVSSDLTELLEVADEVAVMAYGKVRKTFENKDLKPTDVLACCYEAERGGNRQMRGKALKGITERWRR